MPEHPLGRHPITPSVLTAHATKEHQEGRLLELKVLEKIKELRGRTTTNLPYLSDYFETKGPHGQHLCLVLPALSIDISRFMNSAPLHTHGLYTKFNGCTRNV